jgi:hypothetical protein
MTTPTVCLKYKCRCHSLQFGARNRQHCIDDTNKVQLYKGAPTNWTAARQPARLSAAGPRQAAWQAGRQRAHRHQGERPPAVAVALAMLLGHERWSLAGCVQAAPRQRCGPEEPHTAGPAPLLGSVSASAAPGVMGRAARGRQGQAGVVLLRHGIHEPGPATVTCSASTKVVGMSTNPVEMLRKTRQAQASASSPCLPPAAWPWHPWWARQGTNPAARSTPAGGAPPRPQPAGRPPRSGGPGPLRPPAGWRRAGGDRTCWASCPPSAQCRTRPGGCAGGTWARRRAPAPMRPRPCKSWRRGEGRRARQPRCWRVRQHAGW